MKILTGSQIKAADRYTIENEPISSIDLMERASSAITQIIIKEAIKYRSILFLIGKGNNGGDGLAIARLLSDLGNSCSVYCPFNIQELTEESRINFERLPTSIGQISLQDFKSIKDNVLIIDTLLGTGIKGEIREPLHSLIRHINTLPNKVISVDIPSGMCTEFGNKDQIMIKSDATITIQFPKLSMLLPEAGENCGEIVICPIGINIENVDLFQTPYFYLTKSYIDKLLQKRTKFAHKGTYGHALLICGSKGMSGAAILSTTSALRSGCGLVTLHISEKERYVATTCCPSAILSLDPNSTFSKVPSDLQKYNSLGIGSGLGQAPQTEEALYELLTVFDKPMVIDADALNILSNHKEWLKHVPNNSILTPHLGELKRLIGNWNDEEEKLKQVKNFAVQINSIIIVKGAYTMICIPDGSYFFNSTGNSGMAKGGSGDVLTGYITGLLARGYSPKHAAILGVYIHGLAGDEAALRYGKESMNSMDIANSLAEALQALE